MRNREYRQPSDIALVLALVLVLALTQGQLCALLCCDFSEGLRAQLARQNQVWLREAWANSGELTS